MWEQWLALGVLGFLILIWVFHNLQFFVRIRNNVRAYIRSFKSQDWTIPYHVPLKHPRVLKRKQVLSFTAAPQRIQHLAKNFASFSMSQVDTILLNLPKLFRNKDPQDAVQLDVLQRMVPKLQILWHEEDTGPDLKILGSLDWVSQQKSDAYIVIIDDDTLQKNVLLEDQDTSWDILETAELTQSKTGQRKKQVISSQVQNLFGFGLALGFASQCFRFKDLDKDAFVNLCKKYRECDQQCKRHDDFTVTAAFEDLQFKIVQGSTGHPLQLEIGFQSDALHQMIPAEIKHFKCSDAIWTQRQQSPNKQFNLYEKGLRWYSDLAHE